jgi:hypothetical protein
MASTPIANEGLTNSTTPVTVLAAPAASTQRVVPRNGVNVVNRDTVNVTLTLSKNKGGTLYSLAVVTLATLEMYTYPGVIVLDATNESVELVLGGAVTTSQPSFDAAAMETTA